MCIFDCIFVVKSDGSEILSGDVESVERQQPYLRHSLKLPASTLATIHKVLNDQCKPNWMVKLSRIFCRIIWG